jgi:anti-sigma B factor antagonist
MEIGPPDPADPEPPDTDRPASDDQGADDRGADEQGVDDRAGDPAPDRFALVVQDDPAGTIVAVTGELDLLSAPRLRTALDALVRSNPRHIAIDLTATTFMDSAGVHVLVDACNAAGGHLAVISPEGPVRQVIDVLGLNQALNVVSSLDEYRARRAGS